MDNRIKYFLLSILFVLLVNGVSAETYTEKGSIYDNGDIYWDAGEIDYIKYSLKANVEFKVDFSAAGNLELFLCSCSSSESINSILKSLNDNKVPSNLYLSLDSYSSTSGSYTPTTDISLNIAIFTLKDSGSIPYTINSNLASNNYLASINANNAGSSDVDGTLEIGPTFIIIFFIIVIGFISYYFYDKKSKERIRLELSRQYIANQTKPYNYNQPLHYNFEQPKVSNYTPEPRTVKAVFCTECGVKGITNFCTNCGERLI